MTHGFQWRMAAMMALALSAAVLAESPRKHNTVNAVRFWSLGDTTRVVIETEREFEYRSDRVPNPDRLFFDLLDSRNSLGKRGQHTITVGDKLLKQIRVAETTPGTTRVVFDLEPGVEYSASPLSSPSRLIVELRSTNALVTNTSVSPDLPVQTAAAQPPAATRSTETRTGDPKFEEVAKDSRAAPKMIPPPAKVQEAAEPVLIASVPAVTRSTVKLSSTPDPTQLKEKATARLRPPKPAKLGESGSSMTRILGLKIGRVVIDAGHGGHDTGTSGPSGLLEKDLVLDIAKRVGALVEKRLGSEVVYSRSDDTFIPLEMRTQIANEQKADLFLSIHANSSPDSDTSGVETYYLNFATSKTAMEVAARENASSQQSVHELKDLVQKIALHDKVDESKEFAAKVQQSLYQSSVRGNSRSRDRGVRKAPFVVLIGAGMPSILAEVGFISNPRDEALFKKPEFRQKIAEGLCKGLLQYASTLSQFKVAKSGS